MIFGANFYAVASTYLCIHYLFHFNILITPMEHDAFYQKMPPYPGMRHSMEISNPKPSSGKLHVESVENKCETSSIDDKDDNNPENGDDWAAQYEAYLMEEEAALHMSIDDDMKYEDVNDSELEGEDWAIEYAKYCEEKERAFFDSYTIKEE